MNVIDRQEVEEALKKLKNGNTSEEDGIANKMLKRRGPAVRNGWCIYLIYP
jgi:hypothetical protein